MPGRCSGLVEVSKCVRAIAFAMAQRDGRIHGCSSCEHNGAQDLVASFARQELGQGKLGECLSAAIQLQHRVPDEERSMAGHGGEGVAQAGRPWQDGSEHYEVPRGRRQQVPRCDRVPASKERASDPLHVCHEAGVDGRRDLLLDRRQDAQPAPAINTRQQYARQDGHLCFRSLKTGSTAWRTIDLDADTASVLLAHLEVQEFSRRSWGDAYKTKLDLVFSHPDRSPHDPDVVTHRFERRAEKCPGVIRIRLHDLRHTHATLLLEDGETERYVAERLGDTVEMIHETYGHVTPKMRVADVRRLAARLATPVTGSTTVRDRSVTESDSVAG